MHITVACPRCQSTYQVEPSLQGRPMRCPNSLCREVFEVKELELVPIETDPPPPDERAAETSRERPSTGPAVPPESVHQTGSVGDIIPILSAEQAVPDERQDIVPVLEAEALPPAELPRPAAPSWQQAPPVRRGPRAPEPKKTPSPEPRTRGTPPTQRPKPASPPPRSRRTPVVQVPLEPPPPLPDRAVDPPEPPSRSTRAQSAAATVPDPPAAPLELPPGAWEAPPVRRPGAAAAAEPPDESPPAFEPEPQPGATARRRARWLMAGISVAVLGVLAAAGWFAWSTWLASEGRLREQARRDYHEGRFMDAAGKFRTLAEKFPDSADLPEYQLLAPLSELRADLQGIGFDPKAQMEKVEQFLRKHEKGPHLKEHGPGLAQSLTRLLSDYASEVAKTGDPKDAAVLDRAEQLLAELDRRLPGGLSPGDRGKLADSFGAARASVARREQHQRFLDRLNALLAAPGADAVRQARRLIKEESANHPDVERDPAVGQVLAQLYEGHRARVAYVPMAAALDASPPPAEKVEPSLLVDQLTAGQPGTAPAEDRVVLALARGLLSALARDTGEVRWAVRVGIDTAELPVRVPATLANPEMFLVLSADSKTLTALDADGERLWPAPFQLTAPCLGRPVVVEQRAYIPTYDGVVHEIELVRGHLLGRYHLGQRLSVGGVRQPGTHLLYFAADDSCVYVLNVDPKLDPARRRCEFILYSQHPSGSLRSEPILTTWSDRDAAGQPDPAAPQGYLILPLAHGLDAVELQTYSLPLTEPNARPLAIQPRPQSRGWTWFPPYHDPEKVALATDAGVFDLFGIRQLRNQDAPLFRILQEEMRVGPAADTALSRRSRSQVVHVQENDFWVLAQGRLQRLRLTFDRRTGPRLVPVWEQALGLGSPLHVGQVDESLERGLGLLVVTQAVGRQTCLATMVDAEDGRIRWQRQLGLVSQGDPLTVGAQVLAADQGGGLFLFDPDRHPLRNELPWQVGGQSVARLLGGAAEARPYLLPAPDGTSAYEIAPADKGTNLVVRHYRPARGEEKAALSEHTVELRSALAGPPALSSDGLLLPLADGSLHRLNLPLDGSDGVDGPDWRAGRSPLGLQPFAAWLGKDELLTTDGGRGLTRWRWPRGPVWQPLPPNKDPRRPTLELPARVVSAPVLLPADPKADRLLCAADAEEAVYLIRAKGDGLEVTRRWQLDGKVTAGPFVRGRHVGCVVDRVRLVWLDPDEEKPLWEYRSPGEEIVGQPQLVEDLLIVADQAGRFVGLDPATGRPRGPGYRLRASVAPASSPVAFGEGRAFAPLTDGTVFLLPLRELRLPDALWGFPAFW